MTEAKQTQGKPKKVKPNVTLKRRVTIRAIVTDKLKEYLRFELSESTRMAEKRRGEIDVQLTSDNVPAPMKTQAEAEKLQINQTLSQTETQLKSIDALEDGALFTQGVIEGFVGISVGDNLYEKLGGMEILIKDGIVQNVTAVGNPAI
jgi:hypothetical protein